MRELIDKTMQWGNEKGLIQGPAFAERQLLKTLSELGELTDEILKGTHTTQTDELGDVIVTLIMVGANLGIDIEDALAVAYSKISKRTGRTENGVFIKDNT